jgi:hypothetical protein
MKKSSELKRNQAFYDFFSAEIPRRSITRKRWLHIQSKPEASQASRDQC